MTEVVSERLVIERDGEPCGGLLARPAGDEPAPAVVLMPAIAGINDYIERVTGELAAAGFACCALDYYTREGGPPDLGTREKILEAVAALPDPRVLSDLGAVIGHLREQPFVREEAVGALGFCIGGTYALLAGVDHPDLGCVVAFYGQLRYTERGENKPRSPLDVIGETDCPLLAHYGDSDHLIPREEVAELQIRVSGKPAEVYVYPGAGHAFHEDFRPPVYRVAAANDAWRRSLLYLDWYLHGERRQAA
jgi:carboxymethylenebutenolidase